MSSDRVAMIRERLQGTLQPRRLEVVDESALHAGHPGARDGRGHFRIRIDAPVLAGLPRLAAHRRIYQAMGELMETDIHALSIELESE